MDLPKLVKTLFLVMIIVFSYSNICCQSFEKSISINHYLISGTGVSETSSSSELIQLQNSSYLCDIGFGFNFPLYSPSQNITFGLNTTGKLGFLFSGAGQSDNLMYDLVIPVAATIRFGAGSNREATIPVGFGIGLGYALNTIVADGNIFMIPGDNKSCYNYLLPYAFAELVFDFQKYHKSFFDNFKIQIAVHPDISQNTYYQPINNNFGFKMTYFCISFIKFNDFR